MKIAVRYQSRGGNTKAVAEAIAKASGVTAETIDTPLSEPVDLLFIGGGIYAFSLDKELKRFIETLDQKMVNSSIAFATGGFMNIAEKIGLQVKSKGIPVNQRMLCIKMGAGTGKVLKENQVRRIVEFVNEILIVSANKR
jgi:flavodoxin